MNLNNDTVSKKTMWVLERRTAPELNGKRSHSQIHEQYAFKATKSVLIRLGVQPSRAVFLADYEPGNAGSRIKRAVTYLKGEL